MCIIVVRPKDAETPDKATFQRCWDANKDGAGIMWARDGRLFVIKGLMTFDEFMATADRVPTDCIAVYHFRIGTHGAKDATNTHPWIVDADTALVHNGIISWLGDDHDVSDSSRLARLMARLDWRDPDMFEMIKSALGTYNKVVVLHADGTGRIFNETQGSWDKKCWYSNIGYRAPAQYTYAHGDYEPYPYQRQPRRSVPRITHEPPKANQTTLLDILTVVRLKNDRRARTITLTLRGAKEVTLTYEDFCKHYSIYDYASQQLVNRADQLAVAIQDLLDQERLDSLNT